MNVVHDGIELLCNPEVLVLRKRDAAVLPASLERLFEDRNVICVIPIAGHGAVGTVVDVVDRHSPRPALA